MKPKSLMLSVVTVATSLPAAALTLGTLPAAPALSGPEAVGLLLIGMLALGLRERDLMDEI